MQHALSNPASPPVVAKVLKPVSIVVLVIEALLALASFALTTAALAYRMIDGRFSPQELKREHDEARVETPYQVIYFVASLLLLVCTLLLFGPKHRHLSSTVSLPSLTCLPSSPFACYSRSSKSGILTHRTGQAPPRHHNRLSRIPRTLQLHQPSRLRLFRRQQLDDKKLRLGLRIHLRLHEHSNLSSPSAICLSKTRR